MKTGALGDTSVISAAAKCDLPKCSACEFGTAKRRLTERKQHIPVKDCELTLKQQNVFPGQRVSMDHFTVTEKGRLYTATGPIQPETM